MKCMALSMSFLFNRPQADIERLLDRHGGEPWDAGQALYVAAYLGTPLSLFIDEFEGRKYPDFNKYYDQYDGILCGDNPGKDIGHAVAKIKGLLRHPEGPEDPFDVTFHQMRNKIFLARMKN